MEILNRKAKFDYFIEEEYEAGIVLTGTEIKSVRNGSCNIKDCYGIIKNGEVFLLNMYIGQYKEGNIYAGASGPVCLPLVLFDHIINKFKYKRILVVATGSLHSVLSTNLNIEIPSISHAISLEVKC